MVPIVWLREHQVTQQEHDEGFLIQIEDWTQNYESKMRGKIESVRVVMQRRDMITFSPMFGKEVRPRVLRDSKPRIISQKIWIMNFWEGMYDESNEQIDRQHGLHAAMDLSDIEGTIGIVGDVSFDYTEDNTNGGT